MAKKKKGTDGPDSFVGGNGADAYDGRDGQDSLIGGGGNDKLWGGGDNDSLFGGLNNDKLWGGAGFDRLSGDEGKDKLWGGAETDAFLFRQGGKYAPGSDIDIIKDLDTKGDDMDDIYIMSMDASIDSFQDIMKHAKQVGDDVRIDFGHGDVLILEHTAKGHLSAELFMFGG